MVSFGVPLSALFPAMDENIFARGEFHACIVLYFCPAFSEHEYYSLNKAVVCFPMAFI